MSFITSLVLLGFVGQISLAYVIVGFCLSCEIQKTASWREGSSPQT